MSGFRSLASFDHWPVSPGGGWESLRPQLAPAKPKLGRSARAKLSKVIEAEIIPRLLLAHDREVERERERAPAASDEVVAFSRHLLRGDVASANDVVTVLRQGAWPYLAYFLSFLRHLRAFWASFGSKTFAISPT